MAKPYMEDRERDGMINSMRCRREEISPELPENPASLPKWQAKQGLNRLNLNGAEHDVMGCLIDRANPTSGLCYPSEEYIAGWIDRPLRTVQRAIRTLWDKRLINITRRSATSNRYFIQWPTLSIAYRAQKAFEKRRRCVAAVTLQKVADDTARSGGSYPPEVAAKPMNGTYEEEPITLSGTFAVGEHAHDDFLQSHFSGEQKPASQQGESQRGLQEDDRVAALQATERRLRNGKNR